MKSRISMAVAGGIAYLAALLLPVQTAVAQTSGAWVFDDDGNWSDSTKWSFGAVANGAGATADFTAINITANRTVTLDSSRTIGHLKAADAGADGSNTRSWALTHASSILTLDTGGGTPTVSFSSKSSNSGNRLTVGVILSGTAGVKVQMLAGFPYNYPVYFTRPNTYTGNTTIDGARLVAADNQAVSSGTVTITNGGVFALHNSVTLTNNILICDGARLGCDYVAQSSPVTLTGGTITLQGGTGTISGDDSTFNIYNPITEGQPNTTLILGSTGYGSYGQWIHIYSAGTFTGPTVVTNFDHGAFVNLYHPDGLGTAATTVTVDGIAGNTADSRLYLRTAPTGINTNKTIVLRPYGSLGLNGGITLVNTINMAGGTVTFFGAGDKTHSGVINLATGTTSRINLGSGGSDWHQTGTITGDGALLIQGTDNTGVELRFYGDNTYAGGTRIYSVRAASGHPRACSSTAFGTGPVTFDAYKDLSGSAGVMALDTDLSMDSEFRGSENSSGQRCIQTGSYVLTATGGFSPSTVVNGSPVSDFGVLSVEDLKFGSDSDGCTYTWQYNETTNDIVSCDTLTFGNAVNTLMADWIGTNDAPIGDFPIMTYGGADPDVGRWNVESSAGHGGRVYVDPPTKRVMVVLSTSGTIIFFK